MDSTFPHPFPPPWAHAWGDDRYGLWAELLVKDVRQRLRWVEPGRFLMGSHGTEKDRFHDEGPQHEVTLTEGLWLADTVCTQALWQAVMGANPSDARDDPQKPVEQVSWDDVQGFCQALQTQGHLPAGVEAALPTEAQWEYACRAGNPTADSFGAVISLERVNSDRDRKWRMRLDAKQHTMPVKAVPASAWGLYQMHGNVWEWCADAIRDYTAQAVSDPSGAIGEGDELRAIRGSSWTVGVRDTRSARRIPGRRGNRDSLLGFRFTLMSRKQPGAVGPRP